MRARRYSTDQYGVCPHGPGNEWRGLGGTGLGCGTDGWVWVDPGRFDASNIEWFLQIPPDRYKVKLYKSDNHMRNFIDCVKSRERAIAPANTAHPSAIPGHLSLIAMLVGRKIKWDSDQQVIVGDPEASKLMTRPYRAPWELA